MKAFVRYLLRSVAILFLCAVIALFHAGVALLVFIIGIIGSASLYRQELHPAGARRRRRRSL
jgi:hypothetical protein